MAENEAYCTKCRKPQIFENETIEFFDTNKGTKKAKRGTCLVCKNKTIKFVKMD